MKPNRKLARLLLFLVFLQSFALFQPSQLKSAALTSVSVTLSNPRLSYYAELSGAHSIGDTTLAIDGSSSTGPDVNTTHLFPSDTLGLGTSSTSQSPYTVSSVISGTVFGLSSPLVKAHPPHPHH